MSTTLSLRLPNSIHKQLKNFAEQDGVSMNQFIATAVAEKIASLATEQYLQERASQGDRQRYESVLDKVPDVAPPDEDEIKS